MALYYNYKDKPKLELGRVYGGIGWPGIRRAQRAGDIPETLPGYLAVIGENRFFELGQPGRYLLFLLDEFKSDDKSALLKKSLEFNQQYNVDLWYGNTDKEMKNYVWHWNQHLRPSRSPEVIFMAAPYAYSLPHIQIHIEILRSVLSAPQILDLTALIDDPICLSYLGPQYAEGDYSTVTASDNPVVAALGYAVTALREYPPEDENDEY